MRRSGMLSSNNAFEVSSRRPHYATPHFLVSGVHIGPRTLHSRLFPLTFQLNIVPDPALHAVLCVGPPRHKPHQHPASLLNTRDGRLCLYGTDVPPLSSGTAAVSTDGLSLPAESADAMSNRTNPELWCFPTCLHCALFIEDNGAVLVRNGSHLRRVIQGARGRKICHDPTGQ